jgi:DNA (cytosine-5)-methyltransferase 1
VFINHRLSSNSVRVVSLFSCAGVGDLGFRDSGFQTVVANEIEPKRAEIFSTNFGECNMIVGDVWEKTTEIVNACETYSTIDVLFATPPCQGMSSNGAGMLLKNRADGKIPDLDPRNRLIIPALQICKSVKPKVVIFENVRGMKNTVIEDEGGELIQILDLVRREIGPYYHVEFRELNLADYGIAQTRTRLITIAVRKDLDVLPEQLYPLPSHIKKGDTLPKWITLRDVIGKMPILDAIDEKSAIDPNDKLHRVSTIPLEKYEWVKNTPYGETAFNNQCISPSCGFQGNRRHSVEKINGRRHGSTSTPINCEKCGEYLPRPYVMENGERRLIKGFPDAYKRMKWEDPAPTITRNMLWLSSEKKLHPEQNRTLSIREAMMIQTIDDYGFTWSSFGDTVIADCIGESVPPRLIGEIGKRISSVLNPIEVIQ